MIVAVTLQVSDIEEALQKANEVLSLNSWQRQIFKLHVIFNL